MHIVRLVLALIFLSMPAWLAAQERPDQQATLRERALKQFDKDGDGKLSPSERSAARAALFSGAGTREQMTWTVGDLEREALVYLPSKKSEQGSPVVFGFHGHGGSSRNAAKSFGLERLWPEAFVVYMQGVPTPGRLTDPEGKRTGWQHDADEQDNRDLKFFDAVLASLREKHQIDDRRIYATGHSNGGGFTYSRAMRPDVFAAVAPSAASSRRLRELTPKPAMHIAGRNDRLVLFSWQERAIDAVKQINGCYGTGSEWAQDCTQFASDEGAAFIAFVHDGTHKYPSEAGKVPVMRSFKRRFWHFGQPMGRKVGYEICDLGKVPVIGCLRCTAADGHSNCLIRSLELSNQRSVSCRKRRKSEVAVSTAPSSKPKRYRCCWTDIRRSQWRLAWDSVGRVFFIVGSRV
jgi:polyhydroxybutyrate depolymerase